MPPVENDLDDREERHHYQHRRSTDDAQFDGTIFGQKVRLYGRDAIYILVLLLSFGLIIGILYHYVESSLQFTREHVEHAGAQHQTIIESAHSDDAQRKKEHDAIMGGISKMTGELRKQTYVFMLPPDRREQILRQLEMPQELKDDLRGRKEKEEDDFDVSGTTPGDHSNRRGGVRR